MNDLQRSQGRIAYASASKNGELFLPGPSGARFQANVAIELGIELIGVSGIEQDESLEMMITNHTHRGKLQRHR